MKLLPFNFMCWSLIFCFEETVSSQTRFTFSTRIYRPLSYPFSVFSFPWWSLFIIFHSSSCLFTHSQSHHRSQIMPLLYTLCTKQILCKAVTNGYCSTPIPQDSEQLSEPGLREILLSSNEKCLQWSTGRRETGPWKANWYFKGTVLSLKTFGSWRPLGNHRFLLIEKRGIQDLSIFSV